MSALVPEIFKFEKWPKYANEMTDDVIHATQYYIKDINGAILANLQCKTLKIGRLIVLQCGRSRVRAPDRTNTQGLKITEENVLPL